MDHSGGLYTFKLLRQEPSGLIPKLKMILPEFQEKIVDLATHDAIIFIFKRGWKVSICPVEVGCRGFVAKSVVSLLRESGVSGQFEENSEGM